jgi:hypothetical protein
VDRTFLTSRRLTAMETLGDLRSGTAGQSLRVLTMVPKDEGC